MTLFLDMQDIAGLWRGIRLRQVQSKKQGVYINQSVSSQNLEAYPWPTLESERPLRTNDDTLSGAPQMSRTLIMHLSISHIHVWSVTRWNPPL